MKLRSIALVLFAASLPFVSTGQTKSSRNSASGFYLRFAAGYAFGQSGTTQIEGTGIEGSEFLQGSSERVTQKKVSFGQGPSLRLAGGYHLSKHVAVELGLHAVIPQTYTYGLYDDYSDAEVSSKAVGPYYAIPAIVLSTGSQWRVYGRAGLGLPLTQTIKQEFSIVDYYPGTRDTRLEASQDLELSFMPAFEGSLGLSHPVNDRLSIQAEFSVISRTAYAKSAELTTYSIDGQELLPLLNTSSKETEYSTEVVFDNKPSSLEPRQELTFPVGFSSVGFNLGVTYSFR